MRIYISSTSSDLERHRAAVISALSKTPHTIVCMEHKAATDEQPLNECLRDVASCDVYVGLFAWRYGFRPPPDRDRSITELEYRRAVECGIPTLVFLLDESLEWPEKFRDSEADGERIRALREELQQTKWVGFFSSPDNLAAEVLASLSVVAENRAGARSRDVRERVVGPVPEAKTRHFQDRVAELHRIQGHLDDRGLRVVLVCGRGGSGKTALVAKLIRHIEQDWGSQPVQDPGEGVDSIVFVQLNETKSRSLDVIVQLIARTLAEDESDKLLARWANKRSVDDGLDMLYNQALKRGRRLIVLDNFESILDEDGRVVEEFAPLRQFVEACLQFRHDALLLATSRRNLVLSPEVEGSVVGLREEVSLDAGLPAEAAKALLRELDPDGSLGAKAAPDELLGEVVRRCGCVPRTLETLIGVLLSGRAWTLSTYVADDARFAAFLEDPRRSLYTSLPSDEDRRVMEVLAVYRHPVSVGGVRFLLPSLPVEAILNRLRVNHVASCDRGLFAMHPLDCEYAYSRIPQDGSAHCKHSLHQQAAEFYLSLPVPAPHDRTSIEDIQPQLMALDHLLSADEAESATALFIDSGIYDSLYWWGHFLLLADMCSRFLAGNVSPKQRIVLHVLLGKVRRNLAELSEAKQAYLDALPLLSKAADPECEIMLTVALGDISFYMSDLDGALAYHRRAEELLAANPNPALQSENAGDLANALCGQGRYEEAQEYYREAIAFSRESGMRTHEGIWNGGLGNIYSALISDVRHHEHRERAILHYHEAVAIARETRDARHESHWNGVLGNLYHRLGELSLAESHLRDALRISSRIGYARGMEAQVEWLVAVFHTRVANCAQADDLPGAIAVAECFLEMACDMDVGDLQTEARGCLDGLRLAEIDQMFQQERADEAVARGRDFLEGCSGAADAYIRLAVTAMRWGRSAASREALQLGADAYTRAISCGTEEALGNFYSGLGDAHALLGELEAAVTDYGEAISRDPAHTGAGLSRAEVQIWLGRYDAAKASLEALRPALTCDNEQVVWTWLMCHVLNLIGVDFSAYRAALGEFARVGGLNLGYNVRDIEWYLERLAPSRFTELQIANSWMIQDLILRTTASG